MEGNDRVAFLRFVAVAAYLAASAMYTSGASYAVTLDRVVPSIGDFDCGQTDSAGNSRNSCIVCAPNGGVRAIAAACDTTPNCVAFDINNMAGRCAHLKSLEPRPEAWELKPGYTHYCKLDGSGRCKTGNDMKCAPVPDKPRNPFCAQCNNQTSNMTGGLCSVCGVDKMLQACAANPTCAAVEYTQSDSCGR